MKVHLIFPKIPPALDGIGDYTAQLATALSHHCDVRILTAQQEADCIPGVAIDRVFSVKNLKGITDLLEVVKNNPPDWLLLQFNQFSYGRWGLNPYLPLVMRSIKRSVPQTRIAWMVHEDFVPATNWKFVIMTVWQRWQFWMLGRYADQIFFSIDPWVQKYKPWFPRSPIRHLPVASNIPCAGAHRKEARQRLGLSETMFVVGVFGTVNASRLLPYIRRAVGALQQKTEDCIVLYVGPHGDAMREAMGGLPLRDAGRLSSQDVSLHLAAMDVHLTPYIDGVSTRRGAFLAGIQHGVATVGTDGALTDDMLRRASGEAFLLTPVEAPHSFEQAVLGLLEDPVHRARIAAAGQAFYEASFSFEATAERFLEAVAEVAA